MLKVTISATKDEGYIPPTFQDFFSPDYTLVTIYLKNMKQAKLNLEIDHNNLEVDHNKLEVDHNNLEVDHNKLEVNNQKIEIPTLISNLDIRGDLKFSLLDIYNKLKDSIFSNSLIVEKIECSPSSADNYIKILKDNNLIEPVKGQGKGKYKFK